MATDVYLVSLGDSGGWIAAGEHVPRAFEAPMQDPDAVAAIVNQQLMEVGYSGEPVILAIPSHWCFAAPVRLKPIPRRNRRRALLSRMEEHLPVSSEELTADFLPIDDEQALGVAVKLTPLRELAAALIAVGVEIECVCPLTCLAAQGVDTRADHQVIVLRDVQGHELIELRGGKPAAWNVMADDTTLAARLDALHTNGQQADVVELEDASADRAAGDNGCCQVMQAALQTAQLIALGQRRPWFDLTIYDLVAGSAGPWRRLKRPLVACAVGFAALIAVSVFAMLWRAQQWEAKTAELLAEQKALYERTLPGQTVPVNVRDRLRSESLRMTAMTGQSAEVPQYASALTSLHELLSSLPADQRFRLLDLRIEPERVLMEGEARSHSEAEIIASAIRSRRRFDVSAPRSQQLKDTGVNFTLEATPGAPGSPGTGSGGASVASGDSRGDGR